MFSEWNPQQVFLMAGAGLILGYLFFRTLRLRRSAPIKWTATRVVEESRATTPEPKDLIRWQVEMHDLARDLKGELTSQMSALQALILSAKEERAKLEDLLKQLPNKAE
jgi:hypothetical protein